MVQVWPPFKGRTIETSGGFTPAAGLVIGTPTAMRYFSEAPQGDVADTQGGTTRDGVHLGAMPGTVDGCLRTWSGSTCGFAIEAIPSTCG